MRHQRLKSVVVEGFTSIRSAALALNDVNELFGANGAGKSFQTGQFGPHREEVEAAG